MKFKTAQRDSLVRAALLDGLILAWEQGLGKSLAAFAWPFLKRARRVLIVAPADLHDQFRETAADIFSVSLPVIRNQDDLRKWRIDQPHGPLRQGVPVGARRAEPGQFPQFFLADHFLIPDVPDLASLHPEAVQAHHDRLDQLEALLA